MTALPKTEHKIFDLTIPSTKTKVMMRQMLVREEKILLMGAQSQDSVEIFSCIKQVVNNCVIEPADLNIDALAIFDLEYMFLKLRSVSINNITKVAFTDSEDGELYPFDIDLDDIKVEWPDKISNTVKIDETIAFTLRYPSAKMYDDREFIDYDGDPYFILAVKCLDKVYDGDEILDVSTCSREEIEEFIDQLTPNTYDEVKEFFKNQPSMSYVITYTNKKDHERRIVLSTLNDFFTLR